MNAMYIIIGIVFFLLGFGCGEINAIKTVLASLQKVVAKMNDFNKDAE